MKKGLLLLAFSICQSIVLAQENSLILKFYGFSDDPLKLAFIMANTKDDNSEERVIAATDYYIQNKDAILSQYDAACFVQYLEKLIQHQNESTQATIQGINTFSELFSQVATPIKEGIERDKQREQEQKMQRRAEHQAMVANSPDRRLSRQTTSPYKIQNSGIGNSAYRTQGSYNDLLTSDPNWNQQVQMWVQQYGVEKTREIVRQKRSNDISQQATIDNTYKSYNERVSQSSGQERIVTGVTENGQAIQLKIKGENVVAYSTGLNYSGQQSWNTVHLVSYSSTGIMSAAAFLDRNLSKQYAYYASINNMRVYFNL
jgi:hypothetical protein